MLREEFTVTEKEAAEAAQAAPPERLGTRAPRWRCHDHAPPAEVVRGDLSKKSEPQPLPGTPNVGFVGSDGPMFFHGVESYPTDEISARV